MDGLEKDLEALDAHYASDEDMQSENVLLPSPIYALIKRP